MFVDEAGGSGYNQSIKCVRRNGMTEIVTLRHVMEKTPLGKARLLAGEAGLDKEVRETNIIEVPDTFRWMRGGEILFSAGYAFGGDGAQGRS